MVLSGLACGVRTHRCRHAIATQAAVSAGPSERKIKKGNNLRARRIGRCVRIPDEDLAAWLRSDGSPTNAVEEA